MLLTSTSSKPATALSTGQNTLLVCVSTTCPDFLSHIAVSENALGSAMDCLNDWSNSDSDSDTDQAQPEVLLLLQPGEQERHRSVTLEPCLSTSTVLFDSSVGENNEPVADVSAEGSTQQSRHLHLQSQLTQPGVSDREEAIVRQGSQQDILKRQNTGGSDFSGSSSSTWSQSNRMQSNSTGFSRPQCAELIGRGAFGSVYKSTWKGRPAAIKVRAVASALRP